MYGTSTRALVSNGSIDFAALLDSIMLSSEPLDPPPSLLLPQPPSSSTATQPATVPACLRPLPVYVPYFQLPRLHLPSLLPLPLVQISTSKLVIITVTGRY